MKRWLVMCVGLLSVMSFPAAARAFHSANVFPDDASEGGGDGRLYTGSPRWEGLDCGVCHVDAPGDASLVPSAMPQSLLLDQAYEPGMIYEMSVTMRGETKGLASESNLNTMALEILDQNGEAVGGFFGFDGNLMTLLDNERVLFARGAEDTTKWEFSWQAPDPGVGYLDFYLVAVDGDGAQTPDQSVTDPLGDDVVAGAFRIAQLGVEAPPFERAEPDDDDGILGGDRDVTGCRLAATDSLATWWLWLVIPAIRRRRATA